MSDVATPGSLPRMRVLHVNNEKTWRGGERQVLFSVVEQRRQGLDCHLACRTGSPLEEAARAGGVPTIGLPASPVAVLPALAGCARGFDLLHCHSGRSHSLGALATMVRPIPIVVSRRVDFVPANFAFNRWKYRRAAKVVCVSKWVATVMGNWGLPAAKMEVVYDAVPGGSFLCREAARRELRARTGLGCDQKIIGNIAALVGHKDQATLLRAAREIANRRNDMAFVIVGEGPLREPLLRLRDDLGLTKMVHFTGYVPQAQGLLSGCDVFAMSSSMEGLGTIVLDAAHAGVPVATTAGGGLPEAVLHERTGLVVAVGDAVGLAEAILRLVDDRALVTRLTAAAQTRVARDFSVPAMVRRHLAIYQALVT
jgi:L-malate glycosyltransferase